MVRGVGREAVSRENPRPFSHHQLRKISPRHHRKMYQKRFKLRRNYYRHQCRLNQPQANHYQSHQWTQVQLQ